MLLTWGKFFVLLAVIYIFGTRASRSADVIAEKKHWAQAFMGAIFVSMITSFPELATGLSAVTLVDAPDIAIGEIFGSCIFNLFIIAIIEICYRKVNLYKVSKHSDLLPLSFAFMLSGVVTLLVALKLTPHLFHIGLSSLIIIGFYLIFIKVLYSNRAEKNRPQKYQQKSLKKETFQFILSALIIIGVGIYLPVVGKEITEIMNWSSSFVGVIFLAFVTSFPELVVSIAAARIGAIDMLLGNIAGSNMFNIAILFAVDLFYVKDLLLLKGSSIFIAIGIILMLMNFIVIFAILRKSKLKVFNLFSVNALALAVLYILSLIISY